MMRRMFLAVHVVPEPGLLALCREGMRHFAGEKFRWTPPEQYHITLKFLGEVPEGQLESMCIMMRDTLLRHPQFAFPLQGTGVFGSRYDPRVLWVGATNSPLLIQLAEDILNACALMGFPRERLPLVPHLTLARIAAVRDKQRLSQWVTQHRHLLVQSCRLEQVTLFESVLRPEGAIHLPFAQFPLHPAST
jgi:2'-5' RNA ligase